MIISDELIKLVTLATSSLKDYREEDRTYRVDAKAMLDLIAAVEEIQPEVDAKDIEIGTNSSGRTNLKP